MTPEEIEEKLSAPFEDAEVKFKPAVVKENRAMALAYVDARVIQDRLDDVVGVAGWQDEYEFLPDGSCVCRLKLKIGEEWITKMDVGGESEQQDEGDRRKAALSDSLKRAAVKFGVGRYLYRTEAQWVDYDPKKKQFVNKPKLPDCFRTAKAAPAKKPPPQQATVKELVRPPDSHLSGNQGIQPQHALYLEALIRSKGYDPKPWMEREGIKELILMDAASYAQAVQKWESIPVRQAKTAS